MSRVMSDVPVERRGCEGAPPSGARAVAGSAPRGRLREERDTDSAQAGLLRAICPLRRATYLFSFRRVLF